MELHELKEDVQRCIHAFLAKEPLKLTGPEKNLLMEHKECLTPHQQYKFLGIGSPGSVVPTPELPESEEEVLGAEQEGKPCCGAKRGHKKDCPNK